MMLSLKSLRQEQKIQNFFCGIDDLESGFEVLSLIVAQGDVLLEAYITDDNGRTDLPVESFDGQPFRLPIRRLQKQWNSVLTKSTGKGSVHFLELKANTNRLITTNQSRINHINWCITKLTDLKLRAQETIIDLYVQQKMINQYQALLDVHRDNLTRIEAHQQKNQLIIRRLER